jgi:hypothetical protein
MGGLARFGVGVDGAAALNIIMYRESRLAAIEHESPPRMASQQRSTSVGVLRVRRLPTANRSALPTTDSGRWL